MSKHLVNISILFIIFSAITPSMANINSIENIELSTEDIYKKITLTGSEYFLVSSPIETVVATNRIKNFYKKNKNRVIINIGGISNITYLPRNKKIIGFDCGPGNILLDLWVKIQHNKNFDNLGRWAKSGKIIDDLLLKFQKDSFFKKIPPKSTGRELFNIDWLNKFDIKNYPAEDIQRTLLELTVVTINESIKKFCSSVDEIYICGGGSKNKFLVERLEIITGVTINTTDKLNIPSQQVEAIAFAWLAKKCIKKQFNNSPTITGSSGPRILGAIHYS